MAGPFTAATIGFVDRTSSTQSRVRVGGGADDASPESWASNTADTSAPAQKPRPAPVTTTAPTEAFGVGRFDRIDELSAHPGRPCVELLGTVQREQHDVVALLLEDLLVVHGA